MVLALYSFLEDSEIGDEATGDHDIGVGSPGWVTLVNRGELLHCRTEFIQFLCALGLVVKQEMRRGNKMAMKAGFKSRITQGRRGCALLVVHALCHCRCGQ